ncbi:MAG: Cof-type HAD-IIB family hydrolase [Loigolactobacillus coryniformis]|jgi:sugar-phosphatase|uniref:Haloacid dehalogenase n=1 Tax=Loigolactobacillus coryniformis subsp. torquens DSM 20004 = KCTC 3535 TaxID=1423822 RepID=A0A2D1KL27_9LACO|nr:Cof-type HAD-IIB family hydrolase [Loigolactobacillus coryniformis]ATO42829.1 haloacid dehalogenase [Loigolactobacillus coryniformis subsp. torquens DSM 20004 = KCTC 3535]KRK68838.1 HAD superfamily hydrolase [Loigolactobacillus coryniformis subsp. torquens DSM 20004 = KCTC 3535]MDN5951340.1 Cof-type HAD-IIB family hydrolase [Loigolactobacillus coryniformis]MDN5954460.1 Cof-type HAD-IIB family hydrolase [Loigolactobacillus coryniformis]
MIKLVVTDMNGTLLNAAQQVDHTRLARLLQRLAQQQAYFAVCSGNQYRHLREVLAPLTADNLIYVAENGASIYWQDQQIFDGALTQQQLADFLAAYHAQVPALQHAYVILTGNERSYTNQGVAPALLAQASKFYANLQPTDLTQVTEPIKKISLAYHGGVAAEHVTALNDYFAGELVAHDSGYGVIDVVRGDVSKAAAVAFLQQRWQITSAEVAAFGDGANDIEMLQVAGQSYAMQNAPDFVKAVAQQVTELDAEHAGVLATLEQLLAVSKKSQEQ